MTDNAQVDAFAHVCEIVSGLCGFAQHEDSAGIAVALSAPSAPLDIRVPPVGFATTSEDVATRIVGALARGRHDDTDAVGIAFPAVKSGARIEVCALTQADGHAVCVAGRTKNGVGSVGLFRAKEGAEWEEAHADLDWLCERLRLLVSAGPLDSNESVVFTISG